MDKIKKITMQDYSSLVYIGHVQNQLKSHHYQIEDVMTQGILYTFIIDLKAEVVYQIHCEEIRQQLYNLLQANNEEPVNLISRIKKILSDFS